MMKEWDQLLIDAAPLIDHLNRPSYFDKAYSGTRSNRLILTDAVKAFVYATDDSIETFEDWESASASEVFPEDFDWKDWIGENLKKNNYFDFEAKNFNGADVKWTQFDVCPLRELMYRDIKYLLNCYANKCFPSIWKDILEIYLHDGFPCGWSGIRPEGQLVVFSNF